MLSNKYFISFLLIITLGFCSYTQKLIPRMYHYDTLGNRIIVNGNAMKLSNSLINGLSNKLLFGGFINEETKEKALKKLGSNNHFGGGFHFQAIYRANKPIFKDNRFWSWTIQLSENAHFEGSYSKKLFNLLFRGNKTVLGTSIPLKNNSFEYSQFLSIGGGLYNRRTKSYITLNVIFPQKFYQLGFDKGHIRFNEDGSEVLLKSQGDLLISSYPYFKGLGGAVNFGFYLPFGKLNGFHGVIKISGKNVGLYQIHEGNHYSIDADKKYDGYSINELVQNKKGIDLLDTLGINKDKKSKLRVLPGYLQVGKIITDDSKRKWQSFFGIRMYLSRVYVPMIYAGVDYRPINSLSLGLQGSYGGYSKFRLGFYINYTSKLVNIGIGTENILGAFMKSRYGQSALIRMVWKL